MSLNASMEPLEIKDALEILVNETVAEAFHKSAQVYDCLQQKRQATENYLYALYELVTHP